MASRFAREAERRLVAMLVQSLSLSADQVTALMAPLEGPIATAVGGGAYKSAADKVTTEVLEPLRVLIDENQLLQVLLRPLQTELSLAGTRIDEDRGLLDRISFTEPGGADPWREWEARVKAIQTVGSVWSNRPPGLVYAVQVFSNVIDLIWRGNFKELVDFDALEDQLLELIAELVPTRVQLGYKWDTHLSPFPEADPVFEINRAVSPDASSGYVDPEIDNRRNDLVLSADIQVNLIDGNRTVDVLGEMRPFKVNLLGNAIDLLSIRFKGLRFQSQDGRSPKITADIDGVDIGAMLSFLKGLQAYLSPGEDNGPFVFASLSPPGVVAGYKYSAPFIPVGGMLLYNVALDLRMILPFEDSQALFKFTFAERRRPFLVSAPPYGGGGFVALTANGKGVVSFEIQIEFGAVVGINFGPLRAQGRVTSGIYLLDSPARRILEGFVRAAGEGSIACFSISVNLEVLVRQENSNMTGSSSFRFSFKVGFAKVSYGFTASYTIEGGEEGGSGNSLAAPVVVTQLAREQERREFILAKSELLIDGESDFFEKIGQPTATDDGPGVLYNDELLTIECYMPDKDQWSRFRRYLDLGDYCE